MKKTEEENLKKKLKLNTFLIVVLLMVLLVILCVVLVKVFSIKDGLSNNDSNLGLVSQSDKLTFYYDYNKGLIKKSKGKDTVLTESQAFSINYNNGYIYFASPNSTGGIDIKKIKDDGKGEETLLSTTSSSTKMYLQNNEIYYLTSNPDTISKIDLNGENQKVILQRGIVDFKVVDETIYFSDMMGYLYSIDINGENYKTIIEESLFEEFQILNNKVYYFDSENNKLMKINLNKTSKKTEVTDKLNCDNYNVTTNGIYYLDKNDFKIKYVSVDGKKVRDVVKINTDNTKINIAGAVLYYIDVDDNEKTVTKQIKTNGKEIK